MIIKSIQGGASAYCDAFCALIVGEEPKFNPAIPPALKEEMLAKCEFERDTPAEARRGRIHLNGETAGEEN